MEPNGFGKRKQREGGGDTGNDRLLQLAGFAAQKSADDFPVAQIVPIPVADERNVKRIKPSTNPGKVKTKNLKHDTKNAARSRSDKQKRTRSDSSDSTSKESHTFKPSKYAQQPFEQSVSSSNSKSTSVVHEFQEPNGKSSTFGQTEKPGKSRKKMPRTNNGSLPSQVLLDARGNSEGDNISCVKPSPQESITAVDSLHQAISSAVATNQVKPSAPVDLTVSGSDSNHCPRLELSTPLIAITNQRSAYCNSIKAEPMDPPLVQNPFKGSAMFGNRQTNLLSDTNKADNSIAFQLYLQALMKNTNTESGASSKSDCSGINMNSANAGLSHVNAANFEALVSTGNDSGISGFTDQNPAVRAVVGVFQVKLAHFVQSWQKHAESVANGEKPTLQSLAEEESLQNQQEELNNWIQIIQKLSGSAAGATPENVSGNDSNILLQAMLGQQQGYQKRENEEEQRTSYHHQQTNFTKQLLPSSPCSESLQLQQLLMSLQAQVKQGGTGSVDGSEGPYGFQGNSVDQHLDQANIRRLSGLSNREDVSLRDSNKMTSSLKALFAQAEEQNRDVQPEPLKLSFSRQTILQRHTIKKVMPPDHPSQAAAVPITKSLEALLEQVKEQKQQDEEMEAQHKQRQERLLQIHQQEAQKQASLSAIQSLFFSQEPKVSSFQANMEPNKNQLDVLLALQEQERQQSLNALTESNASRPASDPTFTDVLNLYFPGSSNQHQAKQMEANSSASIRGNTLNSFVAPQPSQHQLLNNRLFLSQNLNSQTGPSLASFGSKSNTIDCASMNAMNGIPLTLPPNVVSLHNDNSQSPASQNAATYLLAALLQNNLNNQGR